MSTHRAIACLLQFLIHVSFQQNVQLRNVTDFNVGWLFHYGDAQGADSVSYVDNNWRLLNVPHDWAIEGPSPPISPFSQAAASTGYGGYVPSGISWYRKHFSLEGTSSSRKVFIEFDGVMQSASVYVNGKLIGRHPYGYTSFRYDITAAIVSSGDNVVAVKTDTSQQPGERFYKGAGIYREVRVIDTHPVHVDQYGTYVSTQTISNSAATVRVQSTVINDGSTTANVSVQGILHDPDGKALPSVTATSKNIAAGARATFTFDVPVSNPQLWDLTSPHLYSLATTVSVDGTPVDSDGTTLGIRSLTFSATTGTSLNGKTVKFKGVCLHQDYHGLGLAAPKRAMQRRLKQLKALGANAIRTSHDPPSPAFLDLTDRMGFLVLDEFFDVWTQHKYSDVGDYATYFNQNATGATGTPPVPGGSESPPWFQVDVTSIVSRDRNHPSVALYSAGNEIHDSINTRTPLLKRIKEIVNAIDPGRALTQALLQPQSSGDVDGATRTIVDVFGGNYRESEVLAAMKLSPPRAGLVTEDGTATSKWDIVQANDALTGLFLWTGADHLGEANGKWPTVGASPGLIDAVGEIKTIGYSWQKVWGAPQTAPSSTGTSASRLTLVPEQTTVSTDVNDIAYVKATVVDASGKLVVSSAAITFSITGPGVIAAVDSGSQQAETFRGNVRNAYQGIAYALVRATGTGSIVVNATSSGLIAASAILTSANTAFIL